MWEPSMTDPINTSLASLSASFADVVVRTAPAIVSVHSHRSRGSGFFLKPGLVVTCEEALADEGEVTVMGADGTPRRAEIAGRDHTTDIALLRVEPPGHAVASLTAVRPALGSLALVVAARRGAPTAALAMVSLAGERWRSLRGGDIDARIELDARLRHGQQGGLVADASGASIGMAVLGPRRVIVIPSATIQRVAARLQSHGRIARGYLGVGLQPVRLEDGVGAMVMSLDAQGPAAAAGIRQGDVITALNDDRLSGIGALARALGPDSVGTVVDVAVSRAGEPMRFKVTIGERQP